jgi:hypothetical protein
LYGIVFDPDDGGSMFLRNVGELRLHGVTYQKINKLHSHRYENLKSKTVNNIRSLKRDLSKNMAIEINDGSIANRSRARGKKPWYPIKGFFQMQCVGEKRHTTNRG